MALTRRNITRGQIEGFRRAAIAAGDKEGTLRSWHALREWEGYRFHPSPGWATWHAMDWVAARIDANGGTQ